MNAAERYSATDKAAVSVIGGLSRGDKWLVQSWRAWYPGADWTDALLASGVLVEGARRHPSQALSGDAAADYYRHKKFRPLSEQRDRQRAEHEASHCWVALELGMQVVDVRMDDGTGDGVCNFRRRENQDPVEVAAVYSAGEAWVSLRPMDYPAGPVGCRSDRREVLRHTGTDSWQLRDALALAHRILRLREPDVLALADRLQAERTVKIDG